MQILGVSGSGLGAETTATVIQFKEQTGVTFPLLLGDTSHGLGSSIYANNEGPKTPYPLDVVAGTDGTIVYLRHEVDMAAMEQTIQQALAQ